MRALRVTGLTAVVVVIASILSVPAMVIATPWEPGPAAEGEMTIDGWIDLPSEGGTVVAGQPLTVSGWVLDKTAQGWAGIDEIHLYDGRAGAGGVFLGKGQVAQSRPDVGLVFAYPFFAASGFNFTVSGTQLSAGTHTLTVYAHTPNRGWWSFSRTVTVVAPTATQTPSAPTATPTSSGTDSDIVIRVMQPLANTEVSGSDQLIKGWAIDTKCTDKTGVSKVEVYFDDEKGRGTYLGEAEYGKGHGNPQDEFGNERYRDSGWERSWSPTNFNEGTRDIYVYAYSRCGNASKLHRFTVEIKEEEPTPTPTP